MGIKQELSVHVKRYAEVAKTHYVGCTTTASTNFTTPANSTDAVGTKMKHSGSVEGDVEPNNNKKRNK